MQFSSTAGSDIQSANVRVRNLLLYALAVASGSVDAISFLFLGRVFTAFMTGNFIFLGLRVAGVGQPGMVSIVVALASFAVGVYIATRVITPSVRSSLWPQRVTVVLGLSLIAHAVFLVVWFAMKGQPSTDVAHALLGTWALAMGLQSEAVRTFKIEGVFTTAATGTFMAFVRALTSRPASAETWRDAGVLICLLAGATGGGLLLAHAHVLAPVLPFVITLLVVVTAAIYFRERDLQDEQDRRKVA